MIRFKSHLILLTFFNIVFLSCNRTPESRGEEYITYGKASILADESLFPIVDDEHQVFINSYKRAKIDIIYKPINDVIKSFINDTINVAVLPRLLKPTEATFFEKRKIRIR